MSTADFKSSARLTKALRLAALVPYGTTAAEIATIADRVAAMSPADRETMAEAAKINAPSDVTWKMLVQVLRDRRPASDIFARVQRSAS